MVKMNKFWLKMQSLILTKLYLKLEQK